MTPPIPSPFKGRDKKTGLFIGYKVRGETCLRIFELCKTLLIQGEISKPNPQMFSVSPPQGA